jgi:hypothetical protein
MDHFDVVHRTDRIKRCLDHNLPAGISPRFDEMELSSFRADDRSLGSKIVRLVRNDRRADRNVRTAKQKDARQTRHLFLSPQLHFDQD